MSVGGLRYEVRVLGTGASLGPVLAIGGIGFIAFLMGTGGTTAGDLANALPAALELGLPLVVGILVTSIVARDLALELQRSVKTRYRTTLMRRIGLLLIWAAMLAAGATVVLSAAGFWAVPGSLFVGQLSWLGPLLWFAGAGILLAALLQSRSAAASLLGGVWLLQNLLSDWFLEHNWTRPIFLFMTTHQVQADDFMSSRLVVAGLGIVFGVVGLIIKSRTETLDIGGDQ